MRPKSARSVPPERGPFNRHPGSSRPALRPIRFDRRRRFQQKKWVEITGWLLFDFEHVPEAENTNPGGAKNWRATCWEIHPVTSIRVLDSPPDDAFRVAPATVKAVQRAQAEHVNRVPKREQFVEERNEKYRRKFAEDERDEVENVAPAR
jgi:hypothetical protein